ncbi:MAG: hypothetical protein ACREOW_17170 [Thermodesulfobacteriota bacterium]
MKKFKAIYNEEEDWFVFTKGGVHVEDKEIGKGFYPKKCIYPISTIT